MNAFHDSRDPYYRSPGGARPPRSSVTLRVKTDARRATLRLWWENAETRFPMTRAGDGVFEYTLTLPATSGLLWYFFILEDRGNAAYYGNAADILGGEGALYDAEPPSYQLTVYDPAFAPPAWLGDGVMYQIMPDRFHASRRHRPPQGRLHRKWDEPPALSIDPVSGDNRADDFFGGNLNGIREKLDYIASLGVTVLYLNPIFLARSNHKYDTADYELVDPSFGTEKDFTALCAAAAKKGIRVILDGVFSHTGADSRYFNRLGTYPGLGAYQSPDSPYASWYHFTRWPDEYDCWWGFPSLPNVNELDPGYLSYIVTGDDAIAKRWLRRGASGWRLDVADELPMPFLREMRRQIRREKSDAALIGEVWENASCKIAYDELRSYCLGDTLDSVMNYPLREGLIDFMNGAIDAFALRRRLDALYESYPEPFARSLMNLLGSHDKARIINRLSGEVPENVPREKRAFKPLSDEAYARGRDRFIRVWRFVCALPGMPCLYYGDEAGAQGGDDPFCRGPFPWGREDTALTEEIARLNRARLESAAARRGTLRLEASGTDEITAVREYEGETLRVTLSRT